MVEVNGGACENVNTAPAIENVFFCWYTPLIYTNVLFSLDGADARVKSTCAPVPSSAPSSQPRFPRRGTSRPRLARYIGRNGLPWRRPRPRPPGSSLRCPKSSCEGRGFQADAEALLKLSHKPRSGSLSPRRPALALRPPALPSARRARRAQTRRLPARRRTRR